MEHHIELQHLENRISLLEARLNSASNSKFDDLLVEADFSDPTVFNFNFNDQAGLLKRAGSLVLVVRVKNMTKESIVLSKAALALPNDCYLGWLKYIDGSFENIETSNSSTVDVWDKIEPTRPFYVPGEQSMTRYLFFIAWDKQSSRRHLHLDLSFETRGAMIEHHRVSIQRTFP